MEDAIHTLVEALPIPAMLSSFRAGLVLYANEHASRAFGIPLRELIGSRTPDVYANPGDRETIVQILERDGRLEDHEVLLKGPEGARFWALASSQPCIYDGEQVLCTTFLDVTQRKRAEKAVQAARDFAENILETLHTPIAILDEGLRVVSINRAFAQTFRISRAEAVGETFDGLGDVRWNAPRLRPLLGEVIPKHTEVVDFRMTHDLPDLGRRTFSLNARKVYRPGNDTNTLFLSLEDVTRQERERDGLVRERRDAEAERDSMEKQMRVSQRMEAVGRLAGGIAHDFNNILMVIQSYATFVRDEFRKGDPARDDVDLILDAADRAARLTNQLLAFSRRQVQHLAVADINEVVGSLSKMLQRLIGEDVDLVARLSAEPLPVKVDIGQMEQVLMNLAVNARDAMPKGGKLTVETARTELDRAYGGAKNVAIPAGRYVMLAISDSGVGMDRETQSHIFEPFFTTKEKGRGTGLGLSTVYGIVKQSGGYIWVYSEPGGGTAFKIYLPEHDAQEIPPPQPLSPSELGGSETLLVVEDEEAVRKATVRILKRHGYDVLQAGDGAEAKEVVRRHEGTIHLMLTDVVLPQASGRDLADQLTAELPDLKVVFTSGYTDNAIVHHGVLDEGTVFLQKPFSPRALLRKIRATLDAKEPPTRS